MTTTMIAVPTLSTVGRRVLAEAQRRDDRLYIEIGMCLFDARELVTGLDADEAEQLALDGLRWRRWWLPEQRQRRAEHVEADRRRYVVEGSHAISRMIGAVGPSYAELQRRRSTPAWVVRCTAHGCDRQMTIHTYPTGAERCARCQQDREAAAA